MLITDPRDPGFESYANEAEFTAYINKRGIVIAANANVSACLIIAMDYLNGLCYLGEPEQPMQPLPFPRRGVGVDGVPQAMKEAQIRLAILVEQGVNLMPIKEAGGNVTMERVEGAVTVQYDGGSFISEVEIPWLSGLLRGLQCPEGKFGFVDVTR
ncbi:DnaT-like ssDNA-binding protein [Serratia phage vB_SlqS_ZDD2]|nr:DnaT-like ssDNA-binding protein [Serratia phage vB_SlqS_ZDD2]